MRRVLRVARSVASTYRRAEKDATSVGLARTDICTVYEYLVIFLPIIPYTHRMYMVLANPTQVPCVKEGASVCLCSALAMRVHVMCGLCVRAMCGLCVRAVHGPCVSAQCTGYACACNVWAMRACNVWAVRVCSAVHGPCVSVQCTGYACV
jgi:hypothetical protein